MRTERRLKNTVPFKKFLSWYLKGLGIVGVSIVAILATALMILLYVGEVNHQHTNKLGALEAITGAIRDNQNDVNTKVIFKTLKVLFENELDNYENNISEM